MNKLLSAPDAVRSAPPSLPPIAAAPEARPVPSVATLPPPPDDFQAYPTASPSHQVLGLYQRILKQGRMSALDRAPPADQPRLRRELLTLAANNTVRGKGRHARNRALSLGKALLPETKEGLGDLDPGWWDWPWKRW